MSSERREVEQLEQDVDRIRGHIGTLVRELNHRRHEAFDLKLQFRRHAGRVVLVGVAVVALVAGGIAYAAARMRRRRSIKVRVNRLRAALHRISAHPERVAERTPTVSRKMLAAGGGAIAAALGKRIAKRLVSAS
jgi:hypothetical protein